MWGFHLHFKLSQALEFDFWAKFANRPVTKDFFLGLIFFLVNLKGCKSLFDGYNHFGSRNSIREIAALESPESRPRDLPPRYVLI